MDFEDSDTTVFSKKSIIRVKRVVLLCKLDKATISDMNEDLDI